MWYTSPLGPRVEIAIHYNSLSPVYPGNIMGNKWQLSYQTYVYPISDNTGSVVGMMAVMPDGKQDLYYNAQNGGYAHPYRVFNTLSKVKNYQNRYQMQFPDGTVYVYDIPAGTTSNVILLVQIIDPHGQKLTLTYDSTAKLILLTDAMGKTTSFVYTNGLLTQVKDPFGRIRRICIRKRKSSESDRYGRLLDELQI